MNFEEAVRWIHATERFGGRPGLDRMRALLRRIGDPQNGIPAIHVAGTNGKGSTTSLLASVLTEAGFRTGKYISPFVLEFRERMQIDGEMIPKQELAALADEVRAAAGELRRAGTPPTEFELVTAIAFLWFQRRKCDILALEVGLGGRLDATNVIDPPLVSVITRVDYDHTDVLGGTLSEIAREKCGILKKGSRAVSYPDQEEEVFRIIRRTAREKGTPLRIPDLGALRTRFLSLDGSGFSYRGTPYELSLAGPHQLLNAVTAIEALNALGDTPFAVSEDDIRTGFRSTAFPARLEVLRKDPPVLLDGAHNPNGADALAKALEALRLSGLTAVVGMLHDKDRAAVLKRLAPYCREMILTSVPDPRGEPPRLLAETARSLGITRIRVAGDLRTAVPLALAAESAGVLTFGSLYLASAARPVLLGAIGGGSPR